MYSVRVLILRYTKYLVQGTTGVPRTWCIIRIKRIPRSFPPRVATAFIKKVCRLGRFHVRASILLRMFRSVAVLQQCFRVGGAWPGNLSSSYVHTRTCFAAAVLELIIIAC